MYAYVKSQGKIIAHFHVQMIIVNFHKSGKFIPTRRTPGISTSDLLERVIAGYRNCHFDEKLTKMGHAQLRAEGSQYDSSPRPRPT